MIDDDEQNAGLNDLDQQAPAGTGQGPRTTGEPPGVDELPTPSGTGSGQAGTGQDWPETPDPGQDDSDS